MLPFLGFLVWEVTPFGQLLFSLAPLLIPVVLVGIISDQGSRLVRFLSWPPLVYLGLVSYGFYLYHPLIELPDWLVPNFSGGRALIDGAATLLAASLSWFLFEKPLLNYRDRRRSRSAERRRPTLALDTA